MTEQVTPGTGEGIVQETPGTEKVIENKPDTVLTGGDVEKKGWIADDWRERLAANDQKALERLKRFPDVGAVWKSYRDMEVQHSKAKYLPELPTNPTPEQVADYRKQLGVPEKPEQYEFQLGNGLVIGEEDKPLVDHMATVMHEANTPKEIANAVINGYFEMREAEADTFAERQEAVKLDTAEKLKEDWGGNYKPTVNLVSNMLRALPDGVGDALMAARMPDGSVLGNNYNVIKAFASLAHELYPAATVVPGGSGNQMDNIQGQLDEFSVMRKKDPNGWAKNLTARAKERELIDAQLKLKARGK